MLKGTWGRVLPSPKRKVLKKTIVRHRKIVAAAIDGLKAIKRHPSTNSATQNFLDAAIEDLRKVFPQYRPRLEDMDFAEIERRALAHSGQSREGFRHYGSVTGRWSGGGALNPNHPSRWVGSAYDDFMVVERARLKRLADERLFINQEIGG